MIIDWFKKHAATILTCIGAGGVIATAVLTAKETPEANDERKRAQTEKGEEPLTVGETVLAMAPSYIPAIMVGAGTIVCIFGANALNQRQQAMLLSAYAALESSYREYRNKVDAICGPGTTEYIDAAIEREHEGEGNEPPWDQEQTFYIDGLSEPRFFDMTMERVMQAEYHLNREFILRGQVTLNDFLKYLGIEPVMEGDMLGWDEYIGETQFGYRWIDFNHRHYVTDDGLLVCSIEMPFAPHSLMEEDYDWHFRHLQEISDRQAQGV